jgi:hypothetical protein
MFVLQSCENVALTKVAHYSKMYYHTSFHNPALNVASIPSITQFHASTIFLQLIVGNKTGTNEVWAASNGVKFKRNLTKISLLVKNLKGVPHR